MPDPSVYATRYVDRYITTVPYHRNRPFAYPSEQPKKAHESLGSGWNIIGPQTETRLYYSEF
jgi:hypothetical protein